MGTYTKGTTAHIIQKPDKLSEDTWKLFVEGVDRKLATLTEDVEKQFYPILAIEHIGNDVKRYFYNEETNDWVEKVEDATHYTNYNDALNVWLKITHDKEVTNRFKRIVIPVMNEALLTEGLDEIYADAYDGPGYYNFEFAYSTPITTDSENIKGETVGDYESYPMVAISTEQEFVDYIKHEVSVDKDKMFMGAYKMRDFYADEKNTKPLVGNNVK